MECRIEPGCSSHRKKLARSYLLGNEPLVALSFKIPRLDGAFCRLLNDSATLSPELRKKLALLSNKPALSVLVERLLRARFRL